jgi:hypothetical protein
VATALEWLLRTRAIADAKRDARPLDDVQRARLDRARSFATTADVVSDTSGGGVLGTDEARASDQRAAAISLYREAAFWAFAAEAGGEPPKSLAAAFDAGEGWAKSSAGEERALAAERLLVERTFIETAALTDDALDADLTVARAYVAALLAALDERAHPGRAARKQRLRRVGGAAVGVVVAAFFVQAGVRRARDAAHPDLAAAAHWHTSTTLEGFSGDGVGFDMRGPGGANAFFHTREEPSPWIDFDLGKSAAVYRVVVANRSDCCGERTVPLVVELSDDDRTWTTVAERQESFMSWEARFPPRAARYVRLRINRQSYLHLESVEIH